MIRLLINCWWGNMSSNPDYEDDYGVEMPKSTVSKRTVFTFWNINSCVEKRTQESGLIIYEDCRR